MPIAALNHEVTQIIDPQGRGRQFVQAVLPKYVGTRVAGLVLTEQKPPGKWGTATYAVRRTTPPANADRAAQPERMPWDDDGASVGVRVPPFDETF